MGQHKVNVHKLDVINQCYIELSADLESRTETFCSRPSPYAWSEIRRNKFVVR